MLMGILRAHTSTIGCIVLIHLLCLCNACLSEKVCTADTQQQCVGATSCYTLKHHTSLTPAVNLIAPV